MIIADDEPTARELWSHLIASEPDLSIVATAADGPEAVELSAQLDPDVVLMDVRMPDRLDGIRAIRKLRMRDPARPAVVAFTALAGTDLALDSLCAGALGFVAKSDPASCVATAIRSAAQGGAFVSPAILVHLLPRLGVSRGERSTATCTERELDVLELVAQGCSDHDIAKRLFISDATVRTHLQHLREKLCVHSRTELVFRWLNRSSAQSGQPS